jgi:hypothetical protein
MERCDAGACELVFAAFWNVLGERPLETHQLGPIKLKIRGLDSFALHPLGPVEDFRGSNEHFLRVASPQGASASERSGIYNRNLPSGFTTGQRYRRSCGSCAYHDHIELLNLLDLRRSHPNIMTGAAPKRLLDRFVY